jgi:hypothetical protein
MIGQLLPNTNEMLQCILAIQILDLNTASIKLERQLNDDFVPYLFRWTHACTEAFISFFQFNYLLSELLFPSLSQLPGGCGGIAKAAALPVQLVPGVHP